MSGAGQWPSLEELGALIDGELDEAQRAAIAHHLEASPEDRERVATWRRMDQALRIGAATLTPATAPSHLARIVRARRVARRQAAVAAALLALAVGSGAALWAVGPGEAVPADLVEMIRDADAAFRVYPLETMPAHEPGGLAAVGPRLSRHLGTRVTAPALERWGFRLSHDQLLATAHGVAAQLTYVDAGGRRLTCFFRRRPVSADAELRVREEAGVVTAYGAEGELGYAMSGRLPRHEIEAIAEAVYRAQSS